MGYPPDEADATRKTTRAAGNLAAAFSGGYPVTDGLSRSVVDGVKFHLSEVKGPAMDALKRSDIFRHFTGEVFRSQHAAMRALDPVTTERADRGERSRLPEPPPRYNSETNIKRFPGSGRPKA